MRACLALLAAALVRASAPSTWFASTTIAGTAGTSGAANGAPRAALFSAPYGLAGDFSATRTDPSSLPLLYVADTGNHCLRSVALAAGAVTTAAGTCGTAGAADGAAPLFNGPRALALNAGLLVVADTANHCVRAVTVVSGAATTPAGTCGGSPGYADGAGAAALFASPAGVAVDAASLTAYVGDPGNLRVRAVTPGGVVTTLA